MKEKHAFQIKIELKHTSPSVIRTLAIPQDATFYSVGSIFIPSPLNVTILHSNMYNILRIGMNVRMMTRRFTYPLRNTA